MKMLKFILLATTLQFVFAFSFQKSDKNRFYLKGKLDGLKEDATLYLVQYSTGDTIATATSRKGKFSFQGIVPNGTEYYFIRVDTGLSQRRSSEFLLTNKKLTLEGEFSDWPKLILTGSAPHDDYLELVKLWSETQTAVNQKDLIKAYIVNHNNSQYVPDLIRRTSNLFSLNEREQLYAQLKPFAKDSYFGQLLRNDLVLSRKREMIKEGTIIPDFAVTLPDGSKTKALDIIGKSEYTLIDFWASWCKPCREAVPGMKKAYDAFNNQGFNILSIAVSDKEPDWRKAMAEDKTPWTNTRDVEGVCNDIFDIPAIPGFVLVDKSGRLISYQCSGSEVENFGAPLRGDTLMKSIQQLFEPTIDSSLNTIRALKIGDKVPDILLGELASSPGVTKKISDYKGKLLLLDFWSTWCSICIAQFPKIHKLQEQFADKLIILPVGFDADKEGSIRNFLQKNAGTVRGLNLPSVIQKPTDTLLERLFPFSGLPHEVWIDAEGTLIGLTDHRAITAQNIETILAGNVPKFSVSKPLEFALSSKESFLVNRGSNGKQVYGSAFTGYIDSLSCISSGKLEKENNAIWYYQVNLTVPGHYSYAYSTLIPELTWSWGKKKVLIETGGKPFYKDFDATANMDNWAYDEFARNNLFGYELHLPATYTEQEAYQYIREDLDRFFGFRSFIEKRNTKYLALIKKGNIKNETDNTSTKNENDTLTLKAITATFFAQELNWLLPNELEVIDETNYKGTFSLKLDIKIRDLLSMRRQLKQYGFDLVIKEKKLDRLVIKDLRK